MSLVTIILNAYFLLTILMTDDLRCMEYFLIGVQSLSDLVLSGLLGLIHYIFNVWSNVVVFCGVGGFLDVDGYRNLYQF